MMKVPVSIKAIMKDEENRVLLVKNERNKWELPGGRMDLGETPEETVVREIREELNVDCVVDRIIDSWMFEVLPDRYVFIVAYECQFKGTKDIELSEEHSEYRWVAVDELGSIDVAEGYKNSILKSIE